LRDLLLPLKWSSSELVRGRVASRAPSRAPSVDTRPVQCEQSRRGRHPKGVPQVFVLGAHRWQSEMPVERRLGQSRNCSGDQGHDERGCGHRREVET
jgi:hypothetical protein